MLQMLGTVSKMSLSAAFWLAIAIICSRNSVLGKPHEDKPAHKRIISGEESEPHQWPWHAQLQIFTVTTSHVGWTPFCGGSLIDEQWVLTAAHCVIRVDKSSIKVVLGDHDVDIPDLGHETIHSVSEIHFHKKFPIQKPLNDIALVKISPPAILTRFVHPIPLPESGYKVPDGLLCIAQGWGDVSQSTLGEGSQILHHVELPIISNEVCVNKSKPFRVNPSLNICAGGEFSTGRGCYGDSGGGLVCVDGRGRWVLQGVLSWGAKYCSPLYFTVFTRVSSYIDWIHENMEEYPRLPIIPVLGDSN